MYTPLRLVRENYDGMQMEENSNFLLCKNILNYVWQVTFFEDFSESYKHQVL